MESFPFMTLTLPSGEIFLQAALVPFEHGFWGYSINGVLRRDEWEHAHTAEHAAFTELRGLLISSYAKVRDFSRSEFARVNLERADTVQGRAVQGRNYRVAYRARSGQQFVGHTSKARTMLYLDAAKRRGFKVTHSRPVIAESYGRKRKADQYRIIDNGVERTHIITLDCRAPRHTRPTSERSRMMAQAGPRPHNLPHIDPTPVFDPTAESLWDNPDYQHIFHEHADERGRQGVG